MRRFLFLALLLLTFFSVFAGDCEFKGKSLKRGESYQPNGECALYSCERPGSVTGKVCPTVQALKPCKFIPSDLTKPYPDCCPRHSC